MVELGREFRKVCCEVVERRDCDFVEGRLSREAVDVRFAALVGVGDAIVAPEAECRGWEEPLDSSGESSFVVSYMMWEGEADSTSVMLVYILFDSVSLPSARVCSSGVMGWIRW